MKQGVLVWCSDLSGIGGQSQVSKHVVKLLNGHLLKLFCYKKYFNSFDIFVYLMKVTQFLWFILRSKNIVYLVNSRSSIGFIRDLPIYIIIHIFRVKCIIHSHGSDLINLLKEKPLLSKIAIFFLKNNCVIVPSQHVYDELISLLPKITVVENFTEVQESQLIQSHIFNSSNSQNCKIKIVWNSNIIYSKGFFQAADFVNKLYNQGLDVEFQVFGVPMECNLMSYINCKKRFMTYLEYSWFNYIGQVGRSEVIDAVTTCDIVALPSFYKSECQPLALIDAMVLGKYLIVSKSPAIRATYGEYCGKYELIDLEELNVKKFMKSCRDFLLVSKDHSEKAQYRFSKERFNNQLLEHIFA